MGYFEQLLKTGSINLIIGGALILIAIIALIWMYLWSKKTKEYKNILKSIDDKVDACSKEEIGEIWRGKDASDEQDDMKEKSETEVKEVDTLKTEVEETDATKPDKEKIKSACSFNRASAAIETLEQDEKIEAENLTEKVIEKDVTKKTKESDAPIIEKIHFDKTLEVKEPQVVEEEKDEIKDNQKIADIENDNSDDDDDCEVDVFAEIRKMLVETEKNSNNKIVYQQEDELDNVARSGKEYTREELEKLIKF